MSNGEKDAGCSFPLPARPALACRWDGVEMSVGVERWASSFPVKAIALWWSTLKRETLSGISLEVRLEKVVPRPFDEISGVMSCPAHCKWCKLPTFDRRLRWGQQPSMYRVYDHSILESNQNNPHTLLFCLPGPPHVRSQLRHSQFRHR